MKIFFKKIEEKNSSTLTHLQPLNLLEFGNNPHSTQLDRPILYLLTK